MKSAALFAKALKCELSELFSKTPIDIYNIQARKAGRRLKRVKGSFELIRALDSNKENVTFCGSDIIAFVNGINTRSEEQKA